MPQIDLRVGEIRWPSKCCRCGSAHFAWRARTEKILTRSVLAVNEYRKITLHEVPVCNRCEFARYFWFGGAILAAAIGLLLPSVAEMEGPLRHIDIGLFIVGVVLAVVGTTKSPIRIVRFDDATNSLRVEIYNQAVADEMMQREQRRTDLEGHAQYLAAHAEKQRLRDREVMRTIRTICALGCAGGLLMAFWMRDTSGYFMLVFSALCWAPFEWRSLRRRRRQGGET